MSIENYIKLIHSEEGRKGYKSLMQYLMQLRTHFANTFKNEISVGSFYQGFMDMTYFPITTPVLKAHKLKVGVVFNHERIQFELWLVGQNKKVNKQYYSYFLDKNFTNYKLSETNQESIINYSALKSPNFNNLNEITNSIENQTLQFINSVEGFLK
ncbi:hypothetical protein PK35_00895 [Tamlana nanhaiensis]|uniref:DUF7000 domain-containing protein n=1 Tax=Neotamlana nanhaiensis TaxID=1382798 RepID=A0A0D7W6R8_9FLAO|nr:hypothetical protein [Tamlana nanhaiensis]KJD34393.1 hypothetical protein PK35_00895 [Tamlana nanhaiensis]